MAQPAPAVMDIQDRGPLLDAGRFALRITNVGVLGNAFLSNGLSFDPSFEFPTGSGHELLNRAELWVGALTTYGERRVSGGPMLEWRPTLDPSDRVRKVNAGDPGMHSYADDDVDGRVDEERLNGRDDDGDGRVDEDVLLPAQQMLTADYTDDQPEAMNYYYPNGERHQPLHLAVHQRAFAWSLPGHDGMAGIEFTVTNRGTQRLREVRLGFYADLDSRAQDAVGGHLNDVVERADYAVLFAPHADTLADNWVKQCAEPIVGEAIALRDGQRGSGLPGVVIVPLTHTSDPLGWLVNEAFPGVREARAAARAPRRDSTFRLSVYASAAPPGQGGPPILDADRYAALAGRYPTAHTEQPDDYAVLVSCGPFEKLEPGQSLTFAVALAALMPGDSASLRAFETRWLHRGMRLDLLPNTGRRGNYLDGNTGTNGHEICLEPPPGIVFNYDPHCALKFRDDAQLIPMVERVPPTVAVEVTYQNGQCIWTDLDCDLCTGENGVDTIRNWDLDTRLPPSPAVRATPGDHRVRIEWDNAPEQAIRAGSVARPDFDFVGYKVYRLDDWGRESLLPAPEQWQRIGVYRTDARGGTPLDEVTDHSVEPDAEGPGGAHYPVGRYRVEDLSPLNGFDYHYVVTTVIRGHPGGATALPAVEHESPFAASFDRRVVPSAAATPAAGGVWVVPNPYRERAAWEREAVRGDAFTRHVDFMGLPRAKCRIRIYTLAGDLVAVVDHDGSQGDGQASWNLISRNGQDVESGIYLFTVESPLGHQVGRFVVIR